MILEFIGCCHIYVVVRSIGITCEHHWYSRIRIQKRGCTHHDERLCHQSKWWSLLFVIWGLKENIWHSSWVGTSRFFTKFSLKNHWYRAAVPKVLRREWFQSGPRAFRGMFSILTISCKYIVVRCNYTKSICFHWSFCPGRFVENKTSFPLWSKAQLQAFWSLLVICEVKL